VGASVGTTLAVLVVEETLSGITGATGIKTAVLTKKYINEVHEMIVNVFVLRRRFALALRQAQDCVASLLPFDKLRTASLRSLLRGIHEIRTYCLFINQCHRFNGIFRKGLL